MDIYIYIYEYIVIPVNACPNQPIILDANIADGTQLMDVASLSYSATPVVFQVLWYSYNKESRFSTTAWPFFCSEDPYNDVRKYLCITWGGKVKIRRGSQFSQLPDGTKISILIFVKDEQLNLLAPCFLGFYKGHKV